LINKNDDLFKGLELFEHVQVETAGKFLTAFLLTTFLFTTFLPILTAFLLGLRNFLLFLMTFTLSCRIAPLRT